MLREKKSQSLRGVTMTSVWNLENSLIKSRCRREQGNPSFFMDIWHVFGPSFSWYEQFNISWLNVWTVVVHYFKLKSIKKVVNLLKVANLFLLGENMTNWCFKRLKKFTMDSVEFYRHVLGIWHDMIWYKKPLQARTRQSIIFHGYLAFVWSKAM